MRTKRIGIGMGNGARSCNACSTRLLPAPGRCLPPGSFIRVAEQSKLIQHRNLISFFVRARPNSRGGGGCSGIAMEGGRVTKEPFRHVSGGLSAAVADLVVVPCLPPAREGCGGD
jgi:hypothetical protein